MNHFVEKIDSNNKLQIDKVKLFLNKFDLKLSTNLDLTLVIQNVNQEIIATCSKSHNILKGFAIDEDYQGMGITNILINAMQAQLFKEGILHSFIFTKPNYSKTFQSLGYKVISSVERVVLLEAGFGNINKSIKKIKNKYNLDNSTQKTALVMNCNPFTLGHRFLIEKASRESQEVLVFIVEENKAIFPFKDRLNLVKLGVSDLKNVTVIEGGEYIISQATFPDYFIKDKAKVNIAYNNLDATIFADYFCKEFNIVKRIVGEEPYCSVTNDYNKSLKNILEDKKIKVEVVPRLVLDKDLNNKNNFDFDLDINKDKNKNLDFISATKVRNSIKENKNLDITHLELLLPKITLNYLHSEEGKKIIKDIYNS